MLQFKVSNEFISFLLLLKSIFLLLLGSHSLELKEKKNIVIAVFVGFLIVALCIVWKFASTEFYWQVFFETEFYLF